ncbi:MAG: hypothetical protein HZA50_10390 [Planctomycetes bacterium]|nr:hypothetical protein [Planctomycetota bacterium]
MGDDQGWKYEVAGELKATGVGRNSCQTFTAGGRTFLHITLEYAATEQAIAWAKTVLNAHTGTPTIITTHSFINGGGVIQPPEKMGRLVKGDNPTNGAQQIFDKLVTGYDQVFMVLCGHCWSQKHVVLANAKGNDVHVLEQCYHTDTAGGRIDVSENPGNWAYKGESDGDRNGSG